LNKVEKELDGKVKHYVIMNIDFKAKYQQREKDFEGMSNESRIFKETLESMKKLNGQL
jgi:hypothetical protein